MQPPNTSRCPEVWKASSPHILHLPKLWGIFSPDISQMCFPVVVVTQSQHGHQRHHQEELAYALRGGFSFWFHISLNFVDKAMFSSITGYAKR